MEKRPLGSTGLSVTPICEGTSPLGNFPAQYGYEVGEKQAVDTILRILEGPLNFIDTSNNYFDAERRIGIALRERGGLPEDFVLATKVDPKPGSSDLSGARARDSVEESLERLGLDRLQLVFIHDPELHDFDAVTGPGGAVEAMVAMQQEGLIDHIGVAGGPIDLMLRYVDLGVFQAVISHNRYTLVDQSARPLIDATENREMAFINGAPYGGGMLVKGPDQHPNYCYSPASEATKDRVRRMQDACRQFGVPLAAAALRFSLREPAIASTIVGMSSPERLDQTLGLAETRIPDELWSVLDDLARVGRNGVEEPVLQTPS
ncbi:aldo/keto reductase [Hoyosella sp. YIM 151337]|uniref:aldo/keto reductase n=1 Tax=Hoyosella sp. YIM 151337 TaxID=2992742 RepID=UPI0022368B30|nr:aldo/keto reductase [Hoyosella sp. YIM 151337]MCW4354072.1 aldo/keto reductase [Hoyosella sp. YIM 151337]